LHSIYPPFFFITQDALLIAGDFDGKAKKKWRKRHGAALVVLQSRRNGEIYIFPSHQKQFRKEYTHQIKDRNDD
jgi:hypothetical protein